MNFTFRAAISLTLAAGLSPSLAADQPFTALQSAFKEHCIKCHGKDGKVKGKVEHERSAILRDAEALVEAGAFAIVHPCDAGMMCSLCPAVWLRPRAALSEVARDF